MLLSDHTIPVAAGNIFEQPCIEFLKHKKGKSAKNAEFIMRNAFWVGIHNLVGVNERKYVSDTIIKFLKTN